MSSRRPVASTSRLPDPAPPTVASTRQQRSRPAKKQAQQRLGLAQEPQHDSGEEWRPTDGEEEPAAANSRRRKAKGKGKRVRIASPSSEEDTGPEQFVSLSPSPTATGSKGLKGADGSSDDEAVRPDDYWDPRLLPVHQTQRRTRELRRLEYGGYRTALYDAVRDEMDLGKALIDWEAIKRDREREEAEAEEEGRTRVDVLARESRSRAGSRSRVVTPMTGSEAEGLPGLPEMGIGGKEVLPFPSAFSLDVLLRWPRAPTSHGPDQQHDTMDEELWALITSTKTKLERINPALRRPPPHRPRPRSAYAPGGPLADPSDAPITNEDDETTSSESDNLNSDDDDAPLPLLQPVHTTLSTTLDTLLHSLVEELPLGPPPPLDYYQQQQMSLKGRRKVPSRVLGWESVVKVVRGMDGVPNSVAEQLEERLIAAFGPPRPITPTSSDGEDEVEGEVGSPASLADGASPPSKPKRKSRAKSATASAKGKGKRKADDGGQGPAKRRKASRAPASSMSPAPAPSPPFEDVAPPPDLPLPPLPDLPPLSVLEEYRRNAEANGEML